MGPDCSAGLCRRMTGALPVPGADAAGPSTSFSVRRRGAEPVAERSAVELSTQLHSRPSGYTCLICCRCASWTAKPSWFSAAFVSRSSVQQVLLDRKMA